MSRPINLTRESTQRLIDIYERDIARLTKQLNNLYTIRDAQCLYGCGDHRQSQIGPPECEKPKSEVY